MNQLSVRRSIKDVLKRMMLAGYRTGLRLGFHIVPDHYYVSLPNLNELQNTKGTWARRSELPGVSYDIDEFKQHLRRICEPYKPEYIGLPQWREAMLCGAGAGYGYIESQCLYSMVRAFQPKNIIEVGSGISTAVIFAALKRNSGTHNVTAIEPYPSHWLMQNQGVTLLRKPVQTVDVRVFQSLCANDLLFIDSSHTVKPGSDVNYLILEVLPRLKRGVIVHFHDIYFPYDYSRDVLNTFVHWSETSLLHAFLINNDRARMLLSLSLMHYDCPGVLGDVFPEYNREPDRDGMRTGLARPMESNVKQHFPSSTYIVID